MNTRSERFITLDERAEEFAKNQCIAEGDDVRHLCSSAYVAGANTESRLTPGVEGTFGQAIQALKDGFKVARKGWNGKGMYLWLKPATLVRAEWCKDEHLKSLAEQNGGSIEALGTICMFTHDSTGRKAILTGWLASQSDMLLEDWVIVE